MARPHYLKTDHIQNFPDLMGSIHSFAGNERDHFALLRQTRHEARTGRATSEQTDIMLVPAACYPLYPTATGTLPSEGPHRGSDRLRFSP